MKTRPNEPICPQYPGAKWAGITKREYFAALAMEGLCTLYPIESYERAAKEAVDQADALIKELNRDNENQTT